MRDGEKTPAKLFEILETIGNSRAGLSAKEIASVSGIPLSTVFRLLKFLADRDYLRPSEGIYSLGAGLARLGQVAAIQNPLLKLAHPHLESLAEETRETVHLAQLKGNLVVYLDKVEGVRSVRMGSMIGNTSPVYCTGVGKAILAFLPSAGRESILKHLDFKPFTCHTIRDLPAFRTELDRIRRRGYAYDDCEHEDGVCCYAAPVFDYDGYPVAGISVSGSVLYLKKGNLSLARLVRDYAERIFH